MIPVLAPSTIREADAWTIEHEPISSWALMERAASACVTRILYHHRIGRWGDPGATSYLILAGMGNNGGDGLAIARMLQKEGISMRVARMLHKPKGSPDHEQNLALAKEAGVAIADFIEVAHELEIRENDVVIDALFGIGVHKPVSGWAAGVIEQVNSAGCSVISIDMPSGSRAEGEEQSGAIVQAHITLSFQVPKLAFFLADRARWVGEWEVLPIGLDLSFLASAPTHFHLLEERDVSAILRPRAQFDHKGSFGHTLLVSGSKGRMGACVLATRAALRSGTGLVTSHLPACGLEILQTTAPEAMCSVDANSDEISVLPKLDGYSAIGIGPGIGVSDQSRVVVKNLLQLTSAPCVIDADALNVISENPTWLAFLPAGTILTPHPKEFDRLVGSPSKSSHERLQRARDLAQRSRCHVVLKGAWTAICAPDGRVFFNPTGNPGMAKGGSGDVLTGVLAGLLAQGYPPLQACILGVYAHGLAGDLTAHTKGMDGMTAGDLIETLPAAWQQLRGAYKKPSTRPLP